MHKNVTDALQIIKFLGLPIAQQNELTALCFLAVVNIMPKTKWKQAKAPLMGVTPIINWIAENYEKRYAPNTRETIRKGAMHNFVSAGTVILNPDSLTRPTNSPKTVYQIEPATLDLIRTYRTRSWNSGLSEYLKHRPTLLTRYAKERNLLRIPLHIAGKEKITLSPGSHSALIRAIIEDFGSLYVPGGEVVYVGDTGSKMGFFNKECLSNLGVTVNIDGIMPDVVMYCKKRNWLILAEAVTSSGPVDSKRHDNLKKLFGGSSAGLVFVTAFPDQKTMWKYICDIAWETEVWRADAPTHLIHFNGERFLGPY